MGDLREELESAIEEAEETVDETEEETEEEAEGEEESTEGESGDGDEEEGDEGEESDGDAEPNDEDEGTEDPVTKETPAGINAPIGFSPESREKWKDVPDVVKAQIQKREQEISHAMQNTAESRRTHSAITGLATSYATVLAAEGANTPMEAIEGLFKTVAQLRMGTPQQQAQKMSQLIGHYGIDIGMLDQALSGEQIQSTEVTQMQQMMEKELAPMREMMRGQETQKQQVHQQQTTEVNNELAEFTKTAEFLNDVRYDMADLIDLASKRGQKMSFKEAYDKSCAMNPEISKVLADRSSDERLKNSGKRKNAKRNASSSLRAGGGKNTGGKKDQSLRGEIESLWDSYE